MRELLHTCRGPPGIVLAWKMTQIKLYDQKLVKFWNFDFFHEKNDFFILSFSENYMILSKISVSYRDFTQNHTILSKTKKSKNMIFHEKNQNFKISIIFGHVVLFESSFTLIRSLSVHRKYVEVRAQKFFNTFLGAWTEICCFLREKLSNIQRNPGF